ncbi:Major Facilitator Superfamily (MFS) [Thraustotheca clavata]|uniref:Major Facilitator Superfamily (MFS) n=1 Tax=Thraustotheca clavata TaxID=74557 RepID=A0A1V9ZCJ3_9STRA|nr:Major Facilitator Superfamily (MFS) [Thraustotheca clavata]
MSAVAVEPKEAGYRLQLAFFVYYAGSSAASYLSVFLQDVGDFSKVQIGLLQAIPLYINVVGPPFWGMMADVAQHQRLIHTMCIASGAFLNFFVQFVSNFEFLCALIAMAAFQNAPNNAMLDQLALRETEYGRQRMFGSLGYGIGAYLLSGVIGSFGIYWMFRTQVALSFLAIFILVPLPHVDSRIHGTPMVKSPSLLTVLSPILNSSSIRFLFLIVFVVGMILGTINSFLMLYLFNLSGKISSIVGIATLIQTSSEIPVFFFADTIIHYLTIPGTIAISLLAYFIRLGIYAVVTNVWVVLPFEALQGFTFGLMWTAFTTFVKKSSPNSHGTMMGILSAVQNGIGSGLGAFLGGWIYQVYGAPTLWLSALSGVPIASVLLLCFWRAANQEELCEEDETLEETLDQKQPMNYGSISLTK